MNIKRIQVRRSLCSTFRIASRIEFNTPVSYNEFRFKSTFFLSNITRIMQSSSIKWTQYVRHL